MAILVGVVLKSIGLHKAAVSRKLTGCTLTVVEGPQNHLAQPNLVCGTSIGWTNCRTFFRKIERVKIGENAPVDARFYQLFDFGRNFRYLNGLLEMQNPNTPGGELSQGFREASRFKIAYSCAILRLLTRRNFFAKSAKNDEFLHFSTPEPIFLSRTIKTNVFVMKFWVVGASFSTAGVPIV